MNLCVASWTLLRTFEFILCGFYARNFQFYCCNPSVQNIFNKYYTLTVCKATLSEMLQAILKIDPKKTVEIGSYHLDNVKENRRKPVQLSKSETFLTDLMENICEYIFN